MKLELIAKFNPDRFEPNPYPNSKKFAKVTQTKIKPNDPIIRYSTISKSKITKRDIYAAQPGDIIVCLMNTKIRLIGIVDRLCVVPNSFCVLRPLSISTNTLYAILNTTFIQYQFHRTGSSKKSITIKDLKEVMLPYEISPAKDKVLNYLSRQFQNAIINRVSFQDIINNTFNDQKHTLPLELEDIVDFHEINKTQDTCNLGKKDLPVEAVMIKNKDLIDDYATILLTRKFKDITDFKLGIICENAELIKANQNLLKLNVNAERLEAIGFNEKDFNSLFLAKYLAYYFLSSVGKEQLARCFETKENKSSKTLKVSQLKQLQIPIPLNIRYVVESIESQIYWQDAERYSNQFDNCASLFESFEAIIEDLDNNQHLTCHIPKDLFTTREFGFLLALYLVNRPLFSNLNISVVLESMVHYGLFERHQQNYWGDIPIEFYSPHHEVEGDIIIVIKQFEQLLNLPLHAKIIYLEER